MLRLHVQLDSALALLQALGQRLSRPEELLAPALPVVARAIQRNFDQQGRPLPWAPLSPAYARWKGRFYPGRKILELSGRLRRSIRTRVESLSGAESSGAAIVVSTDVPYAAAHQFGVPQRRLLARPFLVLTESDRQEVAQTLAHSLTED